MLSGRDGNITSQEGEGPGLDSQSPSRCRVRICKLIAHFVNDLLSNPKLQNVGVGCCAPKVRDSNTLLCFRRSWSSSLRRASARLVSMNAYVLRHPGLLTTSLAGIGCSMQYLTSPTNAVLARASIRNQIQPPPCTIRSRSEIGNITSRGTNTRRSRVRQLVRAGHRRKPEAISFRPA